MAQHKHPSSRGTVDGARFQTGGHGPSRPSRPPGDGDLWLYGVHPVLAALANPRRQCQRLLATPRAWQAFKDRLAEAASNERAPRPEVRERPDLEALLPPGAVHQGLALLVAPLPEVPLAEILEKTAPVVILDRASDPQNVGAVLRSAAAFGVGAVFLPKHHAPEATGAMAKAASGALETVPLLRVVNVARLLKDLKKAGFWCAGLAPEAPTTLAEADFTGKVALVFGSEGDGLRRLTRESCDTLVRVPMSGSVESLNLSTAAAIALYEVTRE